MVVMRYDGMGDLVMSSGMLRELRRLLPQARITLVCRTPWAAWMRTCPWVDEVLDVENSFPRRFNEIRRMLELFRFARRRLWKRQFEVLLNPGTHHSYSHSRPFTWFSGAPVRIGWNDPDWTGCTTIGLLSHSLPFPNTWHEVDKCFAMLEALDLAPTGRRLETWWTPEEESEGRAWTDRLRNSPTRRLIAVGLAGSDGPKRWPRESFLDAINSLATKADAAFVAFGGRDVADACAWLTARSTAPIAYLGAERPLGLNWSVIAKCDLYLGNDTGFAHMAAAAKVPTVVIMGLPVSARPGSRGDPANVRPYDTPCRVIRPPADTPPDVGVDATRVRVDEVVQAAAEMLGLPR